MCFCWDLSSFYFPIECTILGCGNVENVRFQGAETVKLGFQVAGTFKESLSMSLLLVLFCRSHSPWGLGTTKRCQKRNSPSKTQCWWVYWGNYCTWTGLQKEKPWGELIGMGLGLGSYLSKCEGWKLQVRLTELICRSESVFVHISGCGNANFRERERLVLS
jgi:hypothetical protein